MKLSYSETWADVVRMLRENLAVIAALAGVFLFLPALLTGYFIPAPEQVEPKQFLEAMIEHVGANWHWFLLAQLASMVGAISILLLLLGARGRTVGALIAAALTILPFYFLASLVSNLIILVGMLFLIVPGLYALGRLCLTGPVVVAEEQRNPLTAISRSWDLTEGKGWAVVGLVLLVAISGAIIGAVIGMMLGIVFHIVAAGDLALLLVKIVEALCGAALNALLVVLVAAIYRRLSAKTSAAAAN